MAGLTWHGVLIYIDDLLIYGKNFDQHYSRLREVLDRLRKANLKLSPKKCHIMKKQVTYLGHLIVDGEVKPDPDKTKLIDTYPVPKSIKDVKSYVSLMSYYRKFIPKFAQIAKPLTSLLEKNAEFCWTLECQRAFDYLKTSLSKETNLYLPDFDLPFRLACDASGVAIGAVLSQVVNGKERPISFFSKVLSKQQRNWTVTERELYALLMGCQHYRQYLLGKQFELISDHKPLLFLKNIKIPSAKIARWLMQLEEFLFTVIYKEGAKNQNADCLSRLEEETAVNSIEIIDVDSVLTKEDILKAQREDQTVQALMEVLDKNTTNSHANGALKSLIDKKEELFIDEGLLYRQLSDEHCQVILPPALHGQVLALLHDDSTSGHLGIDKTEARFLEVFYWPNIRKIIAWYIKQCEKCEIFKTPKENSIAPLQPIVSHRILELLVIDFIGPLITSKKGNRYILSMIDHFSKYAVAFATSRQDTQTVIACLKKFFAKFGPVERILSDNGRSFISKEFMEFSKTWAIRKSTSTAYHAQTQGLCEKWNGTVIQILKRYVADTAETWDENLDMATYAYNTAVQRTNGITPYEVMFGRKANTSLSFLQAKKCLVESDYLMKLQRDIARINKIITENQEAVRLQNKEAYDKKSGKAFEVGEQVMLFNPAVKLGESKKFSPHYRGPYIIERKQGETNYVLKPLKDGLKEETVHQNRLKRSFIRMESKQVADEPKGESGKIMSTQEELLQFLQPKQTNTAIVTTTDSDDEWWEEQIGNAYKVPINDIKKGKQENNILVDSTIPLKAIPKEPMKTINLDNQLGANTTPSPVTKEQRVHRTSLAENSTTLLQTPTAIDSETPSSHRWSTPVGEKLDLELSRLLQLEGIEQNESTHDIDALQDDLEQDADTESVYEPARAITPQPLRRNPERARRKPQRYGEVEVNCINTSHKKSNQTGGTNRGTTAMKLWQLSLLMIMCILLPFGHASSQSMKRNESNTVTGNSLEGTIVMSVITKRWYSASPWIEYTFGLFTGGLFGFSVVILIGLIIIRCRGVRFTRINHGLMVLLMISYGGAIQPQVTNNTNLGSLFGPAHVCGSGGHHALYVEIPEETDCTWTDPREPLLENVVVTTYFPRTFSDKITAYGCTVEIKSVTTYMGFWGTKSVLDRDLELRKLDYDQCFKEVEYLKKGVSRLVEVTHRVWSNDSHPFEATFSWLKTKQEVRYRLILRQLEIKFNYKTGGVVSSEYRMHNCSMQNSYCEQSDATIIWQVTDDMICRIREGKTVLAQRMRDDKRRGWMMTSDMGQFTLTGSLTTGWMCGIPEVYESDQGMYIKIQNVTFSKTLMQKIREQVGSSHAPSTTNAGLLAYVAHQLQDMMVELFKKNFLNICRLNQERIIYLHHLASQPNTAYLASRMLLKNESIMGYASGQLLTTYQCDVISEYYLYETDQCYTSIPVTYRNHNKTFVRYLQPTSMDLLALDSTIPCNKPINIFIKSSTEREENKRIGNKLVYRWTGSQLHPEPDLQYEHMAILEHLINISDLQVINAGVYDESHEEVNALIELSMAKDLLVTIANSLHLGATSFDSQLLLNGANVTMKVMKAAVNKVIDTAFPFVKWIGKIIKITIITIILGATIVISLKLWFYLHENRKKIQHQNNIKQFLTSLHQHNEKNEEESSTRL